MVFRTMSLWGTRLRRLSAPALCLAVLSIPAQAADGLTGFEGRFEGVASCGGSTCHSRLAPVGTNVRQNEISIWQDPSSPSGAHSRALTVLQGDLAKDIAARLGLGPATSAPECLGCHAVHPIAEMRGPRFQISDGVSCEACHGAAGGWLASHYAVGATHQENVAKGIVALDNPSTRAALCLDCHFGSADENQFVTHAMMAAGHPRISFELDLYSALQSHYDIDADYIARKNNSGGVKLWAIGQAIAVDRTLTLFVESVSASAGVFPELYFFDCHSCHRSISDDQDFEIRSVTNAGRPVPPGTPPFNDSSMMMLMAAARYVAPELAQQLENQSRIFHAALASDRQNLREPAGRLSQLARQLSAMFTESEFSAADSFAILDAVLSDALSARYTDYAGGEQAVMATDTLLSALVVDGAVSRGEADRVRPAIDRLYGQVRDVNAFRPAAFRASLAAVRSDIMELR